MNSILNPQNFPYNIRNRQEKNPSESYSDQVHIQKYFKMKFEQLQKTIISFRKYLGVYSAVNVFLFLSAIVYKEWLVMPFIFLGVGGVRLLLHYLKLHSRKQEVKALQVLPILNRNHLDAVCAFYRNKRKISHGLVKTIAFSSMFFVLGRLFGLPMFWILLPITIIVGSYLPNLPLYHRRKKDSLKVLTEMGIPIHHIEYLWKVERNSTDYSTNMNAMQVEAKRLRLCIRIQTQKMERKSFLGENFERVLDDCVNQIVELSKRDEELRVTLDAFSVENIENELRGWNQQLQETGNPNLKIEIERSIKSLQSQKNSYKQLKQQQSLLKAQLSGAINGLRQFHLDILRIGNKTMTDEFPSMDDLIHNISEINHYISDLESEYQHLENMDLASS